MGSLYFEQERHMSKHEVLERDGSETSHTCAVMHQGRLTDLQRHEQFTTAATARRPKSDDEGFEIAM